MDLQVYIIIVTVFLVSLCSLLFINKQLRGGKTFEEALAEKRQFAEKLYGPSKKKTTKKTNAGNKKNRDRNNSKNAQDNKAPKTPQTIVAESDGTKSDSGSDYDVNNASSASNEQQSTKFHVEFTEEEIIAPETNTVAFKRQLSAGKLPQHQAARKISATKPPGTSILVNKNTNSAGKLIVPNNGTNETLNHFEKIQPKDDLEIKKHRDESLSRAAANTAASNVSNKKENKKGGAKHGKKDSSPASANTIEKPLNISTDAVDNHLILPIDVVASAPPQKESPKHVAIKEKTNKKKRNDAILIQQLVDAGVASSTTDDVNVNAIMSQLGRAELTRNEIQILIDFLLNKQQDTANVTHSDWSDDIVHKLRKQLDDKDRTLAEEQAASQALHTKLREMRLEWNAERAQFHHKLNAHTEECISLKLDVTHAQQEHQLFVERSTAEKQALNTQLQHLQQKLFQEKNAQSQETAQKIQQLTDTNAQYAAELLTKNNIIQDMQEKFLQIRDESLKKMSDYEQKFQEYVRQSEADVAHLTSETQCLRAECQRKDEYEKLYAIQKYELEQLEARIAEKSKATNQMDDSSKVEIRNLQNALDSTKTELTLSKNELNDSAQRISELNTQLGDLKATFDAESSSVVQQYTTQMDELNSTIQSYRMTINEKDATLNELQTKLENVSADQREQELFKQIADYKEKNNELRKKNWKLIDALQKAEESAFKISSKCKLVTANAALSSSSVSPTKKQPVSSSNDDTTEHIVLRTKQVLERLFPNIPSNNNSSTTDTNIVVDYDTWLANLSSHIEQQQHLQSVQQNRQKQKSLSPSNNHCSSDENGKQNDADSVTGNGNNDDDGDHSHDNGASKLTSSATITASTEELILQNAKLKSTVDEYKSIVAETEGVLTNLEKKVKEQDAYWRNVVQSKDSEIRSLQQTSVPST